MTASTHGRCGVWPSKRSQPSTARSRSSSRPPTTVERAARGAVVDRQRQAPVALLADHPVAHVAQPVELALVAEAGDPADPVDDLHDLVAQARVDLLAGQRVARLVVDRPHADEPLVDEAEEQRRAAAPAVRVAVAVWSRGGRRRLRAAGPRRSSATSRGVASGQPAEALDVDAGLVERCDDRQAERLAQLEVLGAAAGGDVDDARALLLADLVPGDHPVLVRRGALSRRAAARTARLHRRQIVERAGVAPADELGAAPLLQDCERAVEGRAAACPCRARTGRRPGARARRAGPARRPRPRSRSASRASSSRPAAPLPAGRAAGSGRSAGVLAVLVALVHLHLGQAGAAAARTTASCRGPCRSSHAGGHSARKPQIRSLFSLLNVK